MQSIDIFILRRIIKMFCRITFFFLLLIINWMLEDGDIVFGVDKVLDKMIEKIDLIDLSYVDLVLDANKKEHWHKGG